MPREFISHSEDETTKIAAEVAEILERPCVICLYGQLGAGKTAFSRAFIRHLVGDSDENVPSPTYTLVQTYDNDAIWHFDLYRLEHEEQLYDVGWEEAQTADYCLIEWPERLGRLKPQKTVDITIESLPDGSRRFIVEA